MRRSKWSILMCIAVALHAYPVKGQNVTGTQFNLTTPGARSLGMGGAFLGLADDATAAYTNPAGLSNLTVGGPEVAVELRSWDYSTRHIVGGRISGEAIDFGLDVFDPSDGLLVEDAKSSVTDLSFVSLGYILRRGFTVAIYAHRLADYSTAYQSEGIFFKTPDEGTGRTPPFLFATSVDIKNFGATGAYEFTEPFGKKMGGSLSVGVGLSYYQTDVETVNARFLPRPVDLRNIESARLPGGFFGPADYLFDRAITASTITSDDAALGWNLGFLWKLGANQRWSLGGVMRQGAEFSSEGVQLNLDAPETPIRESINIPGVYGVGVAYSTSEGKMKVALDYDRILYSKRLTDFIGRDNPDRGSFRLKDANELHLGMERVILAKGELVSTLRLGGWRETAHDLEYLGTTEENRILYPRGRDTTHWAAGLGLVIGEEYQVDAAVDRSDRVNTFSFSVVRFF